MRASFGGLLYVNTAATGNVGGLLFTGAGAADGSDGGLPGGGPNVTGAVIRSFPIKTGRDYFNFSLRAFPVS